MAWFGLQAILQCLGFRKRGRQSEPRAADNHQSGSGNRVPSRSSTNIRNGSRRKGPYKKPKWRPMMHAPRSLREAAAKAGLPVPPKLNIRMIRAQNEARRSAQIQEEEEIEARLQERARKCAELRAGSEPYTGYAAMVEALEYFPPDSNSSHSSARPSSLAIAMAAPRERWIRASSPEALRPASYTRGYGAGRALSRSLARRDASPAPEVQLPSAHAKSPVLEDANAGSEHRRLASGRGCGDDAAAVGAPATAADACEDDIENAIENQNGEGAAPGGACGRTAHPVLRNTRRRLSSNAREEYRNSGESKNLSAEVQQRRKQVRQKQQHQGETTPPTTTPRLLGTPASSPSRSDKTLYQSAASRVSSASRSGASNANLETAPTSHDFWLNLQERLEDRAGYALVSLWMLHPSSAIDWDLFALPQHTYTYSESTRRFLQFVDPIPWPDSDQESAPSPASTSVYKSLSSDSGYNSLAKRGDDFLFEKYAEGIDCFVRRGSEDQALSVARWIDGCHAELGYVFEEEPATSDAIVQVVTEREGKVSKESLRLRFEGHDVVATPA